MFVTEDEYFTKCMFSVIGRKVYMVVYTHPESFTWKFVDTLPVDCQIN